MAVSFKDFFFDWQEAKIETMETDYEQVQSDLRLAFKRIADLQAVIEDGMDSEEDDEDDSMPLRSELNTASSTYFCLLIFTASPIWCFMLKTILSWSDLKCC